MNNSPTIVERMTQIETLERSVMDLVEDEPQKAYLLGNVFAGMGKRIQDATKEGFRKYFDTQKSLPAGFTCNVTSKKAYKYEQDEEWLKIKSKLEAREILLKNASDLALTKGTIVDEFGEIVDPVSISYTAVYTVTKPKS